MKRIRNIYPKIFSKREENGFNIDCSELHFGLVFDCSQLHLELVFDCSELHFELVFDCSELRVCVLGSADVGKSTLLGVLTQVRTA